MYRSFCNICDYLGNSICSASNDISGFLYASKYTTSAPEVYSIFNSQILLYFFPIQGRPNFPLLVKKIWM